MKKLFALLLACSAITAFASTSISTTSVSGHWDLAGSPYLINNNIQVDASTSLAIDPGVEVIFQGSYRLSVTGILYAVGTSAMPISFHVNDTTGWWDDHSIAGGWQGIYYNRYTGSGPDTSILKYCNIYESKIDSATGLYASGRSITIRRGLSLVNCNIYNNKGLYSNLIMSVPTLATAVIELSNCNIYNNNYNRALCGLNNFGHGTTYIHNNHFYGNTGMEIIAGYAIEFRIEDNELNNNTSMDGTITISDATSSTSMNSNGVISGNRIHHNTNYGDGAIHCVSGRIDIKNNFIYNNHHTSGACGAVEGGGAINVGHNAGTPMDSTFYTIHNNIIANNYSSFHGGAISIFYGHVAITNNQIINNQAPNGGAIYMIDTMPLICKNNIFYGNIRTGNTVATSAILEGLATSTVEFVNNWHQHSSLIDLNGIMGGYIAIGDTNTNINGLTPNMVAPTLTAYYTEDADSADFSLLTTSSCLDKGDNTGITIDSLDYYGNLRICGSTIDIGAYEYCNTALNTPTLTQNDLIIYPNPAGSELNITSTSSQKDIMITNLMGQELIHQQSKATSVTVNVAPLAPGIYIIKVNGTVTRKFVKE